MKICLTALTPVKIPWGIILKIILFLFISRTYYCGCYVNNLLIVLF